MAKDQLPPVMDTPISLLTEICQQGDSTDFPDGIPTLCVSAPEDISGEYEINISVTLPYAFDLSLSSNEVLGVLRTIILLTSAPGNPGTTTRSLAVPCTNEGELSVEVTMLDSNMNLPRRPKVII
jgi:hypothetical protein